MRVLFHTTIAAAALLIGGQAMAQITFYEDEGFRGRVFRADASVDDFGSRGFNDRASSVIVDGGAWEVCQDIRFRGRCVVLRPGSYERLSTMGLNDRLSSVRAVDPNEHYANEAAVPAAAAPSYAYRRRPEERLFEANVTSVHAVLGPPEQRCWVDREAVREPQPGRAVIGALLGGVIGHQIGGGSGRDLATIGGAVAGGVVGANSGRNREGERDVQRCETVGAGAPAYWDVAYEFRGIDHRVQMSSAPGRTVTVNGEGEPRQ